MNKKSTVILAMKSNGYTFDKKDLFCLNPGSSFEVFAAQNGSVTVLCSYTADGKFIVKTVDFALP